MNRQTASAENIFIIYLAKDTYTEYRKNANNSMTKRQSYLKMKEKV